LVEPCVRSALLLPAQAAPPATALRTAQREGLALTAVLAPPRVHEGDFPRRRRAQDHHLDRAPDHPWIARAGAAIGGADGPVRIRDTLRNTQRSAGTLLGHEVTRRTGGEGVAEAT